EDEVRGRERLLGIGGQPDGARPAQRAGQLDRQPPGRLAAQLVRLEQADLVESRPPGRHEPADEPGHPHTPAPQHRQPHYRRPCPGRGPPGGPRAARPRAPTGTGVATSGEAAELRPSTLPPPTAPSRLPVSEPAALPAATASVSDAPWQRAPISAPAKASPAPVRSRTRTGLTPSVTSVCPTRPGGPATMAPLAPRFTTTGGPQAAATPTPAASEVAPVSRSSSSVLGRNTSASRAQASTAAGSAAKSLRPTSTATWMPRPRASRMSPAIPRWACR